MQTITDGTVKWAVRDKRMSAMVDMFYPVGSVYISGKDVSKDDIPFMAYGTWEEITSGLVLQTVISGKTAGDTVDAGLPNITGTTGTTGTSCFSEGTEVFSALPQTCNSGITGWGGTSSSVRQLAFDASKSNAIYGNSDTVQPPAYMVRAWVRTA